jgi:hypothetical protein
MKYHSSLTFDRNFARQLAIFITTTFVIAVLGYIIIMGLYQLFLSRVGPGQNWNLLDGFVGVISLSILVGGLAYPVVDRIRAEVADARDKAKLSYDIYQAINEKLTNPQQEAARRWILSNIPIKMDTEDINTWYDRVQTKIMAGEQVDGMPEGQRAVKMTLNLFDYIGFIAKNYWEIEDDSLDWLSPPIAKIWRRIGPYVAHVRTLRNTSDYYLFAQFIGELCVERRMKRGLVDEVFAANTL